MLRWWKVWLDKKGHWHCYEGGEGTYQVLPLAPNEFSKWILEAETRGQALSIAKRDFRKKSIKDKTEGEKK